ncbi:hypothetical protein HDV05_005273 [Chytridiales sp. JEL 0842]|nr:hypothetical protein HDV05_005273 [Chytridiales sp. JEL 0842]
MDATTKIERWRKLGNDGIGTLEYERVSLAPRRRKPKCHAVVKSSPHENTTYPIAFPNNRQFLHNMLDSVSRSQKKDIKVLWSGHLNHDVLNKKLATTTEAKEKHRVPMSKIPDRLRDYYGLDAKGKRGEVGVRKETCLSESLMASNAVARSEGSSHYERNRVPDELPYSDPQEDREIEVQQEDDCRQSESCESESSQRLSGSQTQPPIPSFTKVLEEIPPTETHVYDDNKRNESERIIASAASSAVEKQFGEFIKSLNRDLVNLQWADETLIGKRLQAYHASFEKVIGAVKDCGDILADIKAEYEIVFQSMERKQRELHFLRSKARKLISQNENYQLLHFEQKQSAANEEKLEAIQKENKWLMAEAKRKLSLYVGYMRPSSKRDIKKNDTINAQIPVDLSTRTLEAVGVDPISAYRADISQLGDRCLQMAESYRLLKEEKENNFVPIGEKHVLEEQLKTVEEKIGDFKSRNVALEDQLGEVEALVVRLESSLKEKEDQYHFLISEYTELMQKSAKKESA